MPYNYARGRSLENRRESDKVRKRIPGAVFRKIVYGFIGISGLIILLRA